MKNTNETTVARNWIIRGEETVDEQKVSAIADELRIDPVLSRLLWNRGCQTKKDAEAFLSLEKEMLGDAFLLKDIREAVSRIARAIRNREKITVYGDYDVDGVTAVCTLYLYLRSKGADVSYYIPNRIGEGYGVSVTALDKLIESGTRLIVTVDTGITAAEEVEYAGKRGVDFVITDHHECRADLPKAVAVVNPHRDDCEYPFKELAGVGVVFKLITAIEETMSGKSRIECVGKLCNEYADLVAIGTIADVMPLIGENKLIVRYGLDLIGTSPRKGLRALMAAAASQKDVRKNRTPQKITSSYIGYTLAPRINAVGRIRSASRAVELFLAETDEKAMAIAEELCAANKERQDEENRIMQEAYAKIEEGYDFEKNPVIVLDDDHWHHGVIGIVSSRITEKYGYPSILISFEGCDPDNHTDEDMGKGSGRSVKSMNLVDALVHSSEHLVKFGGHKLAAGLSVTRGELPAFRKTICDYARTVLTEENLVATLEADCCLRPEEATVTLAEEISLLEPFGVANPVPTFIMNDLRVLECAPVSAGKHTRFLFGSGDRTLTAICFGKSAAELNLYVGDSVDVLFNLDINEWNGRKSLQMIVRDIRLAASVAKREEEESTRFDAIWAGGSFDVSENFLPSRDDFAAVYTLVRRSVRSGCDALSHRAILSQLSTDEKVDIGYIKLKIIIRVLQEMNLLGIEEFSPENYCFKLQFSSKKVDLEKSNILKKLRSQQKN